MDFFKKFKNHSHDELKNLAAFCAGTALLIAVALVLSGSAPFLPQSLKVAVNNLRQTAATANAAAVYTAAGTQTYTVPPGVTSILVSSWGGGGSAGRGTCYADCGGYTFCSYYGTGGGGGYTSATISVTPGEQLTAVIGGSNGYSGVFSGTLDTLSQATALVVAGAGGASGGGSCVGGPAGCGASYSCGGGWPNPNGGAGGGLSGGNANNAYGGTQTAGGTGAGAGGPLTSGSAGTWGGTGGSGWYGGGGGPTVASEAGTGGAGGSGYCAPSVTNCDVVASTQQGVAALSQFAPSNAGNSNDPGAVLIFPAQLSIATYPASVYAGQTTSLTWSASGVDANSCQVYDPSNTSLGSASPMTVGPISTASTYTLQCSVSGYTVFTSTTVSILPPISAPNISASPTSVSQLGTSTIIWEGPATTANSCTVTPSPSSTGGGTTNMSSWTNNGNLPSGTPLGYSTPVIIGNYIYRFGGYTGSTFSSAIMSAPVGNPTQWTQVGSLPSARGGGAVAVLGNYIYIFGGTADNTTSDGAILQAPISNPTSWTQVSTLPAGVPAAYQNFATVGDTLYFFGGLSTSFSTINSIWSATASDPTYWSRVGAGALPPNSPVAESGVAIYGGNVYLVGGITDASAYTKNIYSAPLTSLTSWVSAGSLPSALALPDVAVIGSTLYAMGGTGDGTTWAGTVEHASFSDLNTWNTDTTLGSSAGPGASGSPVILGNTLYMFGGAGTGGWVRSIYSAPVSTGLPLASYSMPSWQNDSSDNAGITWPLTQTTNYTLACTLPAPGAPTTLYLTSGTSWTVPSDWNSSDNTIEVIGAGGGGAGGSAGAFGGGGGAGGVVTTTNFSANAGDTVTYSIGIGGAGGAGGGSSKGVDGTSGGNTTFSSYVAAGGGGGGGGYASGAGDAGFAGGSGGGGGGSSNTTVGGGSGTSGQGYIGSSGSNNGEAGGGGGASGAGTGGGLGGPAGTGGPGVTIGGTTYAVGGYATMSNPSPQAPNTGNGGGGGDNNSGAAGGSGIIIITYRPLVNTPSSVSTTVTVPCATSVGTAPNSCSDSCYLDESSIYRGATLSWCCPSGPVVGSGFSTGGALAGSVTANNTGTYSLSCPAGQANVSLSLQTSSNVISTFTASRVRSGNPSTLSWSIAGMDGDIACTISPTPPGGQIVWNNLATWTGSTQTVPITAPEFYTLSCGNGVATSSVSATATLVPSVQEI